MKFDLGNGKSVMFTADLDKPYLQIFADRSSKGVEFTLDQAEELGLAMWLEARKAKRKG